MTPIPGDYSVWGEPDQKSVSARRAFGTLILWLGLIAFGLAGCTQQFKQDYGDESVSRKMIEVALPMPAEKALGVVTEAAIRGGWTVAQTSPGVVSLVAYRPPEHGYANITLRANIVGSDTARVMVSGTVTNSLAKSMLGEHGENMPILEATKGANLKPWQELQRFAEAIRAAGNGVILPHPPTPPR